MPDLQYSLSIAGIPFAQYEQCRRSSGVAFKPEARRAAPPAACSGAPGGQMGGAFQNSSAQQQRTMT
jgi:hypothetical protein